MIENNSYLVDRTLTDGYLRLNPGQYTSIKVDRTFSFEIEKPYSNCDIPNDNTEEFLGTSLFYNLIYYSPYAYSQQRCLLQCLQYNLLENCSCTDSTYLSLFTNSKDCISDIELNCSYNVWQGFDWAGCLRDCPLECNSSSYSVEISSVEIIGDKYALLIKENRNLLADFVTKEITANAAANSFISLSIFYDTLGYTLITESPKMDIVSLVANIGILFS